MHRILTHDHGKKVAVIVNEFGELAIDINWWSTPMKKFLSNAAAHPWDNPLTKACSTHQAAAMEYILDAGGFDPMRGKLPRTAAREQANKAPKDSAKFPGIDPQEISEISYD